MLKVVIVHIYIILKNTDSSVTKYILGNGFLVFSVPGPQKKRISVTDISFFWADVISGPELTGVALVLPDPNQVNQPDFLPAVVLLLVS